MRMHSLHNSKGTWDWKYSAWAMFNKSWCFLSTMEFYCGHSTQDNWWLIPFLLNNFVSCSSLALSNLKALMLTSNSLIIIFVNVMIFYYALDLCFKMKTQVNILKWSTRVRKNLYPLCECVWKDPKISQWIKTKIPLAKWCQKWKKKTIFFFFVLPKDKYKREIYYFECMLYDLLVFSFRCACAICRLILYWRSSPYSNLQCWRYITYNFFHACQSRFYPCSSIWQFSHQWKEWSILRSHL